jgi:hypothetical protein
MTPLTYAAGTESRELQKAYLSAGSGAAPGPARARFPFRTSSLLIGIEATSSGFIMRAFTATLSLCFVLMRA